MELVSVMLDENPRRSIRRALRAGVLKAAIVPMGSTEQHNEHLAMGHDTSTALHLARLTAECLRPTVIVTPPLAFGVSEHWMDHKGTLTLRPDTFCEVLYEVCDSLRRHGFRNLLLLNAHGGNRGPVLDYLPELRKRLDLNLEFCSYWEAYTPELIATHLNTSVCPGHAAEFETSVALTAFPGHVHLVDEPYPDTELNIQSQHRATEDRRFFREARLATADKGRAMISVAVEWLTKRLTRQISAQPDQPCEPSAPIS